MTQPEHRELRDVDQNSPEPQAARPSAAASVSFDGAAAFAHLKQQCDFGYRIAGYDGHGKCLKFIEEEAKKHADSVQLQPFSHKWSQGKTMSMTNVLAFQNWEKATIRVVLLAHWDTRPTADMEPNEADRLKPIIGANDGASGVAVLLELMRAVKGKTGEIGICYAFVDGEDLGPGIEEMFLGATYFSTHLPNPKPHYGILLDMIGDADLRVPKEQYSDMYAPDLLRALYLHAASVDLRKEFPNVLGQAILDDHLALNKVGIPTVDLIDFDYEPWHTLRDTPDKCSPSSLFKVGKLLETWLTKPNPYRPRS